MEVKVTRSQGHKIPIGKRPVGKEDERGEKARTCAQGTKNQNAQREKQNPNKENWTEVREVQIHKG